MVRINQARHIGGVMPTITSRYSNDKVKPAREWTGIVFKPIQKAVLRTKGEEIMPKKGKPKKKKTGYGKY